MIRLVLNVLVRAGTVVLIVLLIKSVFDHAITANGFQATESLVWLAMGLALVVLHSSSVVAELHQTIIIVEPNDTGKSGADQVLYQILAEVSMLTRITLDRLYLFGFSGEEQFVHRYAMGYPEHVVKFIVGAVRIVYLSRDYSVLSTRYQSVARSPESALRFRAFFAHAGQRSDRGT